MSRNFETESFGSQTALSHPANSWWKQEADLSLAPEAAILNLARRFGADNPKVIANVRDATARCLADQREEERENLAILEGGRADLTTYNQIATYPELAPEYVHWFARTAPRSLNYYNAVHSEQREKVGLELFGTVLQHGDWESAHQLDEFARQLNKALSEDDNCQITPLERTHEIPKKYLFYPTFDVTDNESPWFDLHYGTGSERAQDILMNGATWTPPSFRFGHIERWRGVADVRFAEPDAGVVRIFKRSSALVRLDDEQIHEEDRQLIQGLLRETRSPKEREIAMKVISRIVGRTFETSIKAEKGASRAIIPTSAKYVMLYSQS